MFEVGTPVQAGLAFRNGADSATPFARVDAVDGTRLVEGWGTGPKARETLFTSSADARR